MSTWMDLAETLKEGDTVIVTQPISNGAHGDVPVGTKLTVVANWLNELHTSLVLQGDGGEDDQLWVPGPSGDPEAPDSDWFTSASVTLAN